MEPWDFDYDFSADALEPLAARLGLRGPVARLGAGWDYATFTCDGTVIRVPKRVDTAEGLEGEHALLVRMPALPLAIPRPRAELVRDASLPYPCMLYPFVPGTPLCDATSVCAPTRLGEVVGRFLAQLHAPATRAALAGALEPAEPFTFDEWNAWSRGRLDRFHGALSAETLARVRTQIDASLPPVRAEQVFTHSDLNEEHLLVNAAGEPCALIDWGDAELAPWWFDYTSLWLWGADDTLDAALRAAGRTLAHDERAHLAHHTLLVAINEAYYAVRTSRDVPGALARVERALAFAEATQSR